MTIAYSSAIPDPVNDPGDDVSTMQSNAGAISQIVAIDHVGFNVSGSGQHNQVTFNANNVPVPPVSPPILFTNTAAGLPQLFFYSGNAAHSSDQYVISGNGSVLVMGGIILKWGSYTMANGVATTPVVFASPFPNSNPPFGVYFGSNVSGSPNNLPIVQVGTLTNAGFTAARVSGSSGGTYTYYYLAIGN
jgi:hypothetical protein